MNYKQILDRDLKIANEIIGFYYTLCDSSLENLNDKKAAKYKKRILKFCVDSIYELSDECAAFFDKDKPSEVLFDFLIECEKEYQAREKTKKQAFYNEFSDLPNGTVDALWKMVEYSVTVFTKNNDKFEAVIEDTESYRLSLFVDDLVIPNEYNPEEIFFEVLGITRSKNRFCMSCKVEFYDDDTTEEIKFYFSNPVEKMVVFNCCELIGDPWESLSQCANEIVNKSKLSLKLCNTKELELMPLLKELAVLDCITGEKLDFTLLKEIALKYGFDDIENALKRAEGTVPDSFNENLDLMNALAEMNSAKYEPIWRELYLKIVDTQKQYPKSDDIIAVQPNISQIKREIEKRLISEGYSGAYSDFYKHDSIKGIHLARSYDQTYFVGLKRQAKHFIHCIGNVFADGFSITFISGTDLSKNNKCEDIYSCMFNDNGNRLYSVTSYNYETDDLDLMLSIAVKRAECKPLNKQEKYQEFGSVIPAIIEFVLYLIFAGLLFSLLFNLLFFPLLYGIGLLFGVREGFFEFISKSPWLFSVIFSWVGFGGIMGLVEILSKRK